MLIRRFTIAFAISPFLACARDKPLGTAAPITASLVAPDSAIGEDRAYTWFRVQVAGAGRIDTVRGVLTHQAPQLRPNGEISGLAFDSSGAVAFGYRVSPTDLHVTRVPLPADISSYFSEAAISSNGECLAYIAQTPEAQESAVVVAWPGLREIVRVPAGAGFPSDVNFNHLRWINSTDVEFAIRVEPLDGPWIHVVVRGSKVAKVDTLTKEPDWPQRG